DVALGAFLKLAIDSSSAAGERIQITHDVIAADHVKDNVHAAAISLFLYQRNEIFTMIVNRACSSEIHTGLAFFRIAGSGEYAVATRMHQLNRGGANTAAAAMHEERLARLQSGGVEHIAPDGE